MIGTSEAAAVSGYSQNRIRQLVKSGKLRAISVSGIFVIAPKDLERFLERHRPATGRPKGARNRSTSGNQGHQQRYPGPDRDNGHQAGRDATGPDAA